MKREREGKEERERGIEGESRVRVELQLVAWGGWDGYGTVRRTVGGDELSQGPQLVLRQGLKVTRQTSGSRSRHPRYVTFKRWS